MRRVPLIVGLVVALLASGGCAEAAPSPGAAAASAAASSSVGPYMRGTVVTSGGVQYELVAVEIGDPAWTRLGERRAWGTGHGGTTAAPGSRYVDVTLRVVDTKAPKDAAPRTLGSLSVTADGRAYSAIDTMTETKPAEAPAFNLVTEYELPDGTRDAVLQVPPSVGGTETVTFRLW